MRDLTLALMLAALVAPAAAAQAPAAVAAAGRPAEAMALDAGRRPAEVLRFVGLRSGMAALDVLTGTGYYAEIMGRVVGARGSVTAWAPAGYQKARTDAAFAAMRPRQPNVRLVNDSQAIFGTANAFDFAMINQNYHDFYFESAQYNIPRIDPNVVLAGLFHAMKPGGIVAVIDHVGPAGDTRAIVARVHRIDPATIKADFARAGFVLDGESDLLRRRDDDVTKNVFDPSVRGRTDQVVLRFKKPA